MSADIEAPSGDHKEGAIDFKELSDVVESKFGGAAASLFFAKTNPGNGLPTGEMLIADKAGMMLDLGNSSVIIDPDQNKSDRSELTLLLAKTPEELASALNKDLKVGKSKIYSLKEDEGGDDVQQATTRYTPTPRQAMEEAYNELTEIGKLKNEPTKRGIENAFKRNMRKQAHKRRPLSVGVTGDTPEGVGVVQPVPFGLPENNAQLAEERKTKFEASDTDTVNPDTISLHGLREGESFLGYAARAVNSSVGRIDKSKRKGDIKSFTPYSGKHEELDRENKRRFIQDFYPVLVSSDLIVLERRRNFSGKDWKGERGYYVMKRVSLNSEKWIGKNFKAEEGIGEKIDSWVGV